MNDRVAKTDKKRRGRPPGPPDSVRPNRVVTFVTDSEFERLNELAETTGKSLSALVHDLLAPSFQLLEPLGNDKRGK